MAISLACERRQPLSLSAGLNCFIPLLLEEKQAACQTMPETRKRWIRPDIVRNSGYDGLQIFQKSALEMTSAEIVFAPRENEVASMAATFAR